MSVHSDSSVFGFRQANSGSSLSSSPQLAVRKPSGRARSFRERRQHLSPTPTGNASLLSSSGTQRRRLRSRSARNEQSGNGRGLRAFAFNFPIAFPSSTAGSCAQEVPQNDIADDGPPVRKQGYYERVSRSASCCEPQSVMKRPSCADADLLADWVCVPEPGFCGVKRTPLCRTLSMNTIYTYDPDVSASGSLDHQNKQARLSPPPPQSSSDGHLGMNLVEADGRHCVSTTELDFLSRRPAQRCQQQQQDVQAPLEVPTPKPQFLKQLGLKGGRVTAVTANMAQHPDSAAADMASETNPPVRPTLHYAALVNAAQISEGGSQPTQGSHNISGRLARFTRRLVSSLAFGQKQAVVAAGKSEGRRGTQLQTSDADADADATRLDKDVDDTCLPGQCDHASDLLEQIAYSSLLPSSPTLHFSSDTLLPSSAPSLLSAPPMSPTSQHHHQSFNEQSKQENGAKAALHSSISTFEATVAPESNIPDTRASELSSGPGCGIFDASPTASPHPVELESQSEMSPDAHSVPSKPQHRLQNPRLHHILPWMNGHAQAGYHGSRRHFVSTTYSDLGLDWTTLGPSDSGAGSRHSRRGGRPLSWNMGSRPLAVPPKEQYEDKRESGSAKRAAHEAADSRTSGGIAARRNVSLAPPASRLAPFSANSFLPVAPATRALPQTEVVTAMATAIGTTTAATTAAPSANESCVGTPSAQEAASPEPGAGGGASAEAQPHEKQPTPGTQAMAINAHDMLCRLAGVKNSALAAETTTNTESPPVSLHADVMEEWGLFISRCLRRSNYQVVPDENSNTGDVLPSAHAALANLVVPTDDEAALPARWFSNLSGKELEMLRGLVAKGVPEQFRRQVWMECSGALDMAFASGAAMQPAHTQSDSSLLSSPDAPSSPGSQDEEKRGLVSDQDKEEIELDLLRTAAETHPLAQDEHSIDRLRSVLCAYASLNPDVGYCQGMNKIAFGLLSAGLDPDDALALLRCLLDGGILPADLFKPPMLTLQADQLVLEELVSRCLPELAEHLSVRLEGSVPLAPVTVSWFLTLFADYLPEPMRLRVWDVLFADGYEAVFQACLAILKLCEPTLLHCDTPVAMYTVLQDVRSMMDHVDAEDFVDLAFSKMRSYVTASAIDEIRKLVSQ